MDDIYHGYCCGADCPNCHQEIQQKYLEPERWRTWDSFPGWEFCGEQCGKGVRVVARPILTTAAGKY